MMKIKNIIPKKHPSPVSALALPTSPARGEVNKEDNPLGSKKIKFIVKKN
jgi:hypothetical protein